MMSRGASESAPSRSRPDRSGLRKLSKLVHRWATLSGGGSHDQETLSRSTFMPWALRVRARRSKPIRRRRRCREPRGARPVVTPRGAHELCASPLTVGADRRAISADTALHRCHHLPPSVSERD